MALLSRSQVIIFLSCGTLIRAISFSSNNCVFEEIFRRCKTPSSTHQQHRQSVVSLLLVTRSLSTPLSCSVSRIFSSCLPLSRWCSSGLNCKSEGCLLLLLLLMLPCLTGCDKMSSYNNHTHRFMQQMKSVQKLRPYLIGIMIIYSIFRVLVRQSNLSTVVYCHKGFIAHASRFVRSVPLARFLRHRLLLCSLARR